MCQRKLSFNAIKNVSDGGKHGIYARRNRSAEIGGPIMTVEQVGEHWSIEGTVVWFEKVSNKQVASRETFAAVALEKAERSGFGSFQVMRG
jgi:hypothetical protein